MAIVGAALIASFLAACTTSGDLGLGLALQAQQSSPGYAGTGSLGSGSPVAVEMSFDGGKTQTVTYANTTERPARPAPATKPELALAVAPENTTSAALEAFNSAAPATTVSNANSISVATDKAKVAKPSPKRP